MKVFETAVTLVTGGERDPNGPLSIVGAGILSGEVAAAEAPDPQPASRGSWACSRR